MKKSQNPLALEIAIVYIVAIVVSAGVLAAFFVYEQVRGPIEIADDVSVQGDEQERDLAVRFKYHQEGNTLIRIDEDWNRHVVVENLIMESQVFARPRCGEEPVLVGTPGERREQVFFLLGCPGGVDVLEYRPASNEWSRMDEFSERFRRVIATELIGRGFVSWSEAPYTEDGELRQLVYVDLLDEQVYLSEPINDELSYIKSITHWATPSFGTLRVADGGTSNAVWGRAEVFDARIPVEQGEQGVRNALGEVFVQMDWKPLEP